MVRHLKNNFVPLKFKRKFIAPLFLSSFTLINSQAVLASDEFDMSALETSGPKTNVDLSKFSDAGSQLPGKYHVDIYINHNAVDSQDIDFVQDSSGKLIPTLSPAQVRKWGIKVDSIPALHMISDNQKVNGISQFIEHSQEKFDLSQLRLDLTIPQAYVNAMAQNEVSEELWDEGIPAAILGYDFSGSNTWRNDDSSGHDDSYFLNLHSGINFNAWRLRNYSTWTYSKAASKDGSDVNYNEHGSDSSAQNHWESINTFLQRDIHSIHGILTMGDATTPSDVFDGLTFRGVQLSSDDDMLPDSRRNFAPTIHGIANSNAKVTITQNNSVIYQSYVPPGPFEINDLYSNTTNGDLTVTVKEANGEEHSFVQPFSSVAIMQREGQLKYAFTGGKYRSNSDGEEPEFAQASLIYGLPHELTAYMGTQLSEGYKSGLLGIGATLGDLGSVSVDATYAASDLSNGENKTGGSVRAQYSKSMLSTGSTLTLAAYRYSTEGFYTFQDAVDLRTHDSQKSDDNNDDSNEYNLTHSKRSRWQLTLSQELPEGFGSLYASAYQQDYWNENGYERNISVGYNNSWNGIAYGINYNYSGTPDSDSDQQVSVNVNIPLSYWMKNSYVGYNMNTDRYGDTSQQVSLYGTALKDNNLSYNIMEGYRNHEDSGSMGNATLNYTGSVNKVGVGYNYDRDSHQVNYSTEGGVILHSHGVTFSQGINQDIQSLALVQAEGLDNAGITDGVGISTDRRGYAVVPYLTPYRKTTIHIDTQTLGDNADIESSTANVVPTEGAVVLAKFKTHIGEHVLMTLLHGTGVVPFGATAKLSDDNVSIVDNDGQVYFSGVGESGWLSASWGTRSDQNCKAKYIIPTRLKMDKNKMINVTLTCK